MKKHLSIFLIFLFTLILSGCKDISISLDEYQIEMYVGESYEIKVKCENISDPIIEYIVLDPGVISVDEKGIIKAIEAGSNIVKIGLKNNEKVNNVKLYVKVKNVEVTEINTVDEINIMINEHYQINYELLPANAISDVTFTSIDPNIAYVSNTGYVTGNMSGRTQIIISTNNGVTKTINVLVKGYTKPTFSFSTDYIEKIKVNWNDETDLLKGISAFDEEDGDITNNIEIINKEVLQNYGEQIVKYKVEDSDGNINYYDRKIEVIWNFDITFIGHAGSYFGLMNSEEAIVYAITKLKYQAVEVDIKQTKDGVFVLSHDDSFGGYNIASTNWSELKDVEVTQTRKAASAYPVIYGDVEGDGVYSTKLCTLEKFLNICKQYNVTAVIELKSSNGITNSNQSRMQALMDIINKAEMLENVIFLGSQYNCLIWTRNNGYEYIPCQYLVNSCESEEYLQRCIENDLDISINVTGNYSNGEEWLARYHDAGLKISTYTYSQYVDYDIVQEWINKGVDFVTCDWHKMEKLILPKSSIEQGKTFNVKFVDSDGTILKESQVKQGKYAAAPMMKEKTGYKFIGWDNELKNIQSDMIFTAQYEPITYTIIYNANVDVVTEEKWLTKEEFKNDFYNDLFNWLKSKENSLSELTNNNGEYTFTKNSVTVKFSNAEDIMKLNVYDFEKTISNVLYKPVTRNNDGSCIIVEDENYFLNSKEYKVKYQGMDQWLYNCIKQSYTSYNTTYTPTKAGKIQIFFRMHQWMNGTNIPSFDNYPKKYVITSDTTVLPQIPTIPNTYTILDEIILPNATGNKTFVGWYTTSDCSGERISKIEKGTTGDIVLYAKWE